MFFVAIAAIIVKLSNTLNWIVTIIKFSLIAPNYLFLPHKIVEWLCVTEAYTVFEWTSFDENKN